MSGSNHRLGQLDEQAGLVDRRRPTVRSHDTNTEQAPALAGHADPRLANAGASATSLMALQRTAGNAAVASLVGSLPSVQRDVSIGEVATDVAAAPEAAPTAAAPGAAPAAGTGSPVSSSGGITTISGSQINLDAALTSTPGIIRADTIIATNVIGSNYTPGAGNQW